MLRLRRVLVIAGIGLPLSTFYVPAPPQDYWQMSYFTTPLWGLMALALAFVALELVVPWNLWIGWFVATGALASLRSPQYAISVATWTVCGAIFAAQVSKIERRWVVMALVTLGAVESVILLGQRANLWLAIGEWVGQYQIPHGTYGNPRYLSVALAIITPLAPWWLVPLFLAALVQAQSYTAIFAAVIALGIRYRGSWMAWLTAPLAFAGLFAIWKLRELSLDSIVQRGIMWSLSIDELTRSPKTMVVGFGYGSWFLNVGQHVLADAWWWHAHNEYIQFVYEQGLIGGVALIVFGVVHRRWFVDEPALVALAILCATMAPFHLASMAVVALAVIGLAAGRAK